MRRLLLIGFACAMFVTTGCHIDTRDIGKIADALDRFGATIKDTTKDGGDLEKRIKQLTTELRTELTAAGIAVTDHMALKFAIERRALIEDILGTAQKMKADLRILTSEFQGAGLSIPLQFAESLKDFREEFKNNLSGIIAATPLLGADKKTPINYSGLTVGYRPEGFHTVTFQIAGASTLKLKIGEKLISPHIGAKAGHVEYRIPFDKKITSQFDETREMGLGFQLVDVVKKDGQDEITFRYGGTMSLLPLFPITYKLYIFPPGGKTKEGYIQSGPAIRALLEGVGGTEIARAQQHGAIYRIAETRLALGTSEFEIQEGASFKLTVKFADGKVEVLGPGKYQRVNPAFGSVTLIGPTRVGSAWSFMVDVEVRK